MLRNITGKFSLLKIPWQANGHLYLLPHSRISRGITVRHAYSLVKCKPSKKERDETNLVSYEPTCNTCMSLIECCTMHTIPTKKLLSTLQTATDVLTHSLFHAYWSKLYCNEKQVTADNHVQLECLVEASIISESPEHKKIKLQHVISGESLLIHKQTHVAFCSQTIHSMGCNHALRITLSATITIKWAVGKYDLLPFATQPLNYINSIQWANSANMATIWN